MSEGRAGKGAALTMTNKSDESRQRLYAVAARLFAERGYDKTSIREVAAAYGVESATLYYYVKNKEELLRNICIDTLSESLDGLEAIAAADVSAVEKLQRAAASHMAALRDGGYRQRVMLVEMRALSGENKKQVQRLRDRYDALLEQVLEQGQQEQSVRTDVSAKYLRLALLGLLNWAIFWYRPGKELRPEQLSSMFADLFLSGASADADATGRNKR